MFETRNVTMLHMMSGKLVSKVFTRFATVALKRAAELARNAWTENQIWF